MNKIVEYRYESNKEVWVHLKIDGKDFIGTCETGII
tara:strand:- start:986 stop:1093 length:108 start_codon:yes stop_codon:yes gene_type:complete